MIGFKKNSTPYAHTEFLRVGAGVLNEWTMRQCVSDVDSTDETVLLRLVWVIKPNTKKGMVTITYHF